MAPAKRTKPTDAASATERLEALSRRPVPVPPPLTLAEIRKEPPPAEPANETTNGHDAALPIPRVGQLAAETVNKCCEEAARYVLSLADQVDELAKQLRGEAEFTAESIRKQGTDYAAKVADFTAMAASLAHTFQVEGARVGAMTAQGEQQ